MATVKTPSNRLVLGGISWRTYLRALRTFDERHVRITYDRGVLEIMTLSFEHEKIGYLLGRLIDALTEELGLPISGGKSTSFKRRKKQRGLEPDNCYGIANEPLVRDKTKIDLRNDPPPDLAVAVDISRSSLDRLGIYAALRVPEVWRSDGKTVTFHVLQANGEYAVATSSRAFPGLKSDELTAFRARQGQRDVNALVREFRVCVRERLAAGWQ